MLSHEERWAKRDAQRAADEAYYAEQEQAETERLAAIIAPVFDAWWKEINDYPAAIVQARVAVRALRDAGVIFASMGPCCERHHPEQFDGQDA